MCILFHNNFQSLMCHVCGKEELDDFYKPFEPDAYSLLGPAFTLISKRCDKVSFFDIPVYSVPH